MKRIIIGILMLLYFNVSFGQDVKQAAPSNAFSLKEAQDYAIKNSPDAQTANIDRDLALAKKSEVRGIGLPQVTASIDNKYNQRTIFNSLIDKQLDHFYEDNLEATGLTRGRFDELVTIANQYTASQTPTPSPINDPAAWGLNPQEAGIVSMLTSGQSSAGIFTVFNSVHNATAGLQASQLVFSNDYLIALKAAKAYAELSEQGVAKSAIDIKVAVAKAYYNTLVAKERFKLLGLNISRLEKTVDDTRKLNESGFVEKIDLDRLEVMLNNIRTEKEKVEQLLGLGEAALKFQMGYDITQPINLTDSLSPVAEQMPIADSKVNFNNRVDYNMLKSSEKLNELDLKRYQYGLLPTVAAYGAYNYQAFSSDSKFNFYKGQDWYRSTLIGATLNIKLLTGGQGYYKTQQAKLNLLKTRVTIQKVEQGIQLEATSARIMYNNSLSSLKVQKKNIELAESIHKTSKAKYDQGVGSNLELLNAETSLKEAQTNYYGSLFDYYIAKIDLDKALGNIK